MQHKDYSEHTAIEIDDEIRKLVLESMDRAKALLQENKDRLLDLAQALLEKEVLDGAEIDQIIQKPREE